MNEKDVVLAMTKSLESADVPYMIVGSLSSNAYGIARSTQDADFVIQLGDTPLSALRSGLPDGLKLDPQASFETVTCTQRYIVRLTGGTFKVELFLLSGDAHDIERFNRRVKGEAFGRPVWLPTPEDVIVTKLRWSQLGKRSKDVDDVRNVIAVQQDRIDWVYVSRWCDEHGTRELLERVRSSIPKI